MSALTSPRAARRVAPLAAGLLALAGCGGLSGPTAGPGEQDQQGIAATLATFAQLACARLVERVPESELLKARVDPTATSVRAFFDAVPRADGCRAAGDWNAVDIVGTNATASDGGVSYELSDAEPAAISADRLDVELRKVGEDWWVVGLTEASGE